MWLKEVGFVDKIKEWWNSYRVSGLAGFVPSQESSLRNKEVFGIYECNKIELWLTYLGWI